MSDITAPDYSRLLQSYMWQDYDLAPRFPKLVDFLDLGCQSRGAAPPPEEIAEKQKRIGEHLGKALKRIGWEVWTEERFVLSDPTHGMQHECPSHCSTEEQAWEWAACRLCFRFKD